MQLRSISFIGRQSGDSECFCWDDVPIDQRKSIVGNKSHAFDVAYLKDCEHNCDIDEFSKSFVRNAKTTLTRLYPDDIMKKLKVGKKPYRITITVEPV